MERLDPSTPRAVSARRQLDALQRHYATRLEENAACARFPESFVATSWLRDNGRHGGGTRLGSTDGSVYDQASLNVSGVHYEDDPGRPLVSATALSCIVHPRNPLAPSMHMHLSWTELRNHAGYWRVMADLNPSVVDAAHTARFASVLETAAGNTWEEGRAQGDRYFQIPALGRTRGVVHYYLEGLSSGDVDADEAFAVSFGRAVIDAYCDILIDVTKSGRRPTADDRMAQLAYHTLYVLQVLTLDRGTTAGVLVHSDNDAGILGSLPRRVSRALLTEWVALQPNPLDQLLRDILDTLAPVPVPELDDATRLRLAETLRRFHRAHPGAMDLQARGNVLPPTVSNHQTSAR